MNRNDIEIIVLEELEKVQQALGNDDSQITPEMRPIGDLEGFDSQLAEDTTASILGRLEADPDTKCPFTVKEAGKYLTLNRVIDLFCQAAGVVEA